MQKQAPGGPQVTAPGAQVVLPDAGPGTRWGRSRGRKFSWFLGAVWGGGEGGRFHFTGAWPSIDPGEERSESKNRSCRARASRRKGKPKFSSQKGALALAGKGSVCKYFTRASLPPGPGLTIFSCEELSDGFKEKTVDVVLTSHL